MGNLFRAGLEHFHAGRILRARRDLARAVSAGGQTAVWAAQELVQTYLRRGDVDAALPALRDLLADRPALLDHVRAYLHRLRGEREAAYEFARRAVHAGVVAAKHELGWLLHDRGDAAGARRLFADAERRHRAAGDRWGASASLTHRATLALAEYRLDDAERLLGRARRAKESCGDRRGLQHVLINTGILHQVRNRYHEAIQAFTAARDVGLSIGDRRGVASCWNEIGVAYLDLAEPELAAAALARSAAILARLGLHELAAVTAGNQADAIRILGRHGEAIRRYRRGLALLPASMPPANAAVLTSSLARCLTAAGRPAQALRELDALAARAPDVRDLRAAILLARERARAEAALGRWQSALGSARHALALGHRAGTGQPMLVELADARGIAGESQLALGQVAPGRATLHRAAAEVDVLLATQRSASIRIGLLDTSRTVHDAYVASWLAMPGPSPRRAWQAAAELKVRELRLVLTSPGPGRPARSRRARPPAPPRTTRDQALVEYHVAAGETIAFLFHGRRMQVLRLSIGRAALDRAVDRLIGAMRASARAPGSASGLLAFDLERARRLYGRILKPVLDRLPAEVTRLTIVPDGPLHRLPLETLVVDAPSAGAGSPWARIRLARYAGDGLEITYAPSSLLLEPGRRGARRPRAGRLVALGHSPRGHRDPLTEGFGPLPGAHREARRIARDVTGSRVLTGRHATAEAYRRLAGRAGCLHLAAHAVAVTGDPGRSGIVLASGHGESHLLSADEIRGIPLTAKLVVLSACDGGSGRVRSQEGPMSLARSFLEAGARSVLCALWPVDDGTSADLMTRFYRRIRAGEPGAQALARSRREIRSEAAGPLAARAHPFFWAPFILVDRDALAEA